MQEIIKTIKNIRYKAFGSFIRNGEKLYNAENLSTGNFTIIAAKVFDGVNTVKPITKEDDVWKKLEDDLNKVEMAELGQKIKKQRKEYTKEQKQTNNELRQIDRRYKEVIKNAQASGITDSAYGIQIYN